MGWSQKQSSIYEDQRPGMKGMYHPSPGLRRHRPRHLPPSERGARPPRAAPGSGFPWGGALLGAAVLGLLWLALANVPQLQGRKRIAPDQEAPAPSVLPEGKP